MGLIIHKGLVLDYLKHLIIIGPLNALKSTVLIFIKKMCFIFCIYPYVFKED